MQSAQKNVSLLTAAYKKIENQSNPITLVQRVGNINNFITQTDLGFLKSNVSQEISGLKIEKHENLNLKQSSKNAKSNSKKQIRRTKIDFFRQLLEYLIKQFSEYTFASTIQNSKPTGNNQGPNQLNIKNIMEKLQQSEKYFNYSLRHYRILAYNLNTFTVSQMKEEDIKLHDTIFNELFKLKQYELVNKIKEEIMFIVHDYIDKLIKKQENGDVVVDNSQSTEIIRFKDQYLLDNNNLHSMIKKINQQQCQNVTETISVNQLNRIQTGLRKMQNNIFVTRF